MPVKESKRYFGRCPDCKTVDIYSSENINNRLNRVSRALRIVPKLLLIFTPVIIGNCGGPYDSFDRQSLRVSSDKTSYAVGDTITLKFEILYGRNIRVFKERRKSLGFSFGAAIGDQRDTSDYHVYTPDIPPNEFDEIDTIDATQDRPFCVTVKGVICKLDDGLLFDFGEFGKFRKKKLGRFYVRGGWNAIKLHPLDSGEYYTNTIYFEVLEENKQLKGY